MVHNEGRSFSRAFVGAKKICFKKEAKKLLKSSLTAMDVLYIIMLHINGMKENFSLRESSVNE